MKKKKYLEEEINEFFDIWDSKQLTSFLTDMIPIFKLYDVDLEDDWVAKETHGDEEHVRNVRLIRTVYLLSKFAEFHAAKLCKIKVNFKDIYLRMEKHGLDK